MMGVRCGLENLSKEERGLLYRLVSGGVQATLAELDDEYLELDVLAKHELALHFAGLAKKGLIQGTGQDEDDWYVDMWGMLNLRAPELTQAGRDYFVKEQQMSCVEFYAPGKEPGAAAGGRAKAVAGAAAVTGITAPVGEAPPARAFAGAGAETLAPAVAAPVGRVGVNLPELRESLPEKAGNDQLELNELLLELEEMIENLEQTKFVVKNSGFVRRLEKYRDKHGWFYNNALALLGQAVLDISCGRKQI